MKLPYRQRRGSGGFTLIEVIVTIVILTLGLLTILGVFLGSAKANRHAQKVDIAHHLAQETIEQFRNSGYGAILSFEEGYGDIVRFPQHRREVIVNDRGTLKDVQVIVHFDNDLHSAQFRTFYADL